MSKRVQKISIPEFEYLLEFAQKTHYLAHKPRPELVESSKDKLQSCLNTPFQKFFGISLYRGFLNKASILFYLLNRNHVLLNGNKRMACLALV